MREIIQKEISKLVCDFCKEECEYDAIEMSFGYGSDFDMETKNFCSDECCCDWVINNMQKELK